MDKCNVCRWLKYRPKYPCNLCRYYDPRNEYNFFVVIPQPSMFGVAELEHGKSCGKKVSLQRIGRCRSIRCACGNSMRAKCSDEEMIERWNNRVPAKTSMWKVKEL